MTERSITQWWESDGFRVAGRDQELGLGSPRSMERFHPCVVSPQLPLVQLESVWLVVEVLFRRRL